MTLPVGLDCWGIETIRFWATFVYKVVNLLYGRPLKIPHLYEKMSFLNPLFFCEKKWILLSNINLQFRLVVKWNFWSKIDKKGLFCMGKYPEMPLFMVLTIWIPYSFEKIMWALFSCNIDLQFRLVVKWDFLLEIGKKYFWGSTQKCSFSWFWLYETPIFLRKNMSFKFP